MTSNLDSNYIDEGRVYAFGEGVSGQLGLGNGCVQTYLPTIITGLGNQHIINVDAGESHSSAISGKFWKFLSKKAKISHQKLPSFVVFVQCRLWNIIYLGRWKAWKTVPYGSRKWFFFPPTACATIQESLCLAGRSDTLAFCWLID